MSSEESTSSGSEVGGDGEWEAGSTNCGADSLSTASEEGGFS